MDNSQTKVESGETGEVPGVPTGDSQPQCACVRDPFAALPLELRPRLGSDMKGLRKVTCPGCGLIYWTNRETDQCTDCEKKAGRSAAQGLRPAT